MYSPASGRFLQTDPIGYAGGLNLYAYVNNDPLNNIDPYGLYAGIDDAAFAGVGAVIGVGLQAGTDLLTGNRSTAGEYAFAAIQGAATGLGVLYAPATGGASVVAAGAGGGAAGNFIKQGIDNGGYSNFSYGSLAQDTATGFATSFIPVPGLKGIPGVTAGANSFAAIGRKHDHQAG